MFAKQPFLATLIDSLIAPVTVFLILTVAILVGGDRGATATPSHDRLTVHRAVHFIMQTNKSSGAECTATAVGRHALLTATHCEVATDELRFGEEKDADKATIVKYLRDGHDHTIYLLKGITFTDVAEFAPQEMQQGDRVFFWGNPGNERDQYREGVVQGRMEMADENAFLIDMRADSGDSGSAVFNSENQIVGVLSGVFGDKIMESADCYPLQFKAEQITKAKEF